MSGLTHEVVKGADPGATEPPEKMTCRDRFLAACHHRAVDRPPIWLMRQAGRALPEYRALKAKHNFTQLLHEPELAAEVTLQPIRRFGFDAAILFCDILVVPEAMGVGFQFQEGKGVRLDYAVRTSGDVARLCVEGLSERLAYVRHAVGAVREELKGRTALLGFSGAPWTLANFLLEGGSMREPTKARELLYSDPSLFHQLMEKLTQAVIEFLRLQIEAGVDGVQIFESLGGYLPAGGYQGGSLQWIRRITSAIGGKVPVLFFAKGIHGRWGSLAEVAAQVIGVDWTQSLREARAHLPERMGIQGNLDPMLMNTSRQIVALHAQRMLETMRGRLGYIVNLGHGLPATAKLEAIESLVQTVHHFA